MVLKLRVPPDLIGGDVDAGYGKVADAFRAAFRDGAEVGAAVAVYRDGVRNECGDLSDELTALRNGSSPDTDFLWVGLKDPTPEEFALVSTELSLHPLAVEDVLSPDQRAKVETYDGTLLAVVKTLRYVEATSDIETGQVVAFISRRSPWISRPTIFCFTPSSRILASASRATKSASLSRSTSRSSPSSNGLFS